MSKKSEKRQGIKRETDPAGVSLALKSYGDIGTGTSVDNMYCSNIERRI